MRPLVAVLSLLLMVALLLSGMNCFKISSYNVPQFNHSKSSNYRIIHTLTRICSRYDITLLMDVQDLAAVKTLLSALNSENNRYSEKFKYKSVSSQLLGKDSKHPQYYTFIYRTQTVNLTGQHQYQSPGFVRPPFVVRFQSNKTLVQEFVLIPLHSEPSKAIQEIDKLYDVFEEVVRKWNNKKVIFLGDFHAGCGYMDRHDKKKIRLFTNTDFSWLISDRMDTTVTEETHCPYDRMVVHGKSFLKQIKPFSAQVFNPMKNFKIRSAQLLDVSDHYPLEVELKSSVISLLHATSHSTLLLVLQFLYLTL